MYKLFVIPSSQSDKLVTFSWGAPVERKLPRFGKVPVLYGIYKTRAIAVKIRYLPVFPILTLTEHDFRGSV